MRGCAGNGPTGRGHGVLGRPGHHRRHRPPGGDLPINAFTERELSLLGSTVCTREDFVEAIRIVGAHRDAVARLITHERPLADAVEAIAHAMANPHEVMKLVIRGDT
jgi:threonine dehydrogenase-like Zn-dependent dehydrogenase